MSFQSWQASGQGSYKKSLVVGNAAGDALRRSQPRATGAVLEEATMPSV